MYRLQKNGFQAYLVGGAVRDLLLGREPKDFDVVTDARPYQIRALFKRSRIIGRRFRLVHVYFGQDIIEVATFRRQVRQRTAAGMILDDNQFGSIEEDAWRRDFSVNALYYNIADFSVVDYVGALPDLEAGILRLIGEPVQRYQEDPVRMLRAVRFTAKLGFKIEAATEQPLFELSHLLNPVPVARLYDEALKLFLSGHAVASFEKMRHYGLFRHLFPLTEKALSKEDQGFPIQFVRRSLQQMDKRVSQGKPISPAFFFACLLWYPFKMQQRPQQSWQETMDHILAQQMSHTAIPKRIGYALQDIWFLQRRLEKLKGKKKAVRLLTHRRFRAAYDFLLLRAQCGDADPKLAHWWTRLQKQQGLDPHGRY